MITGRGFVFLNQIFFLPLQAWEANYLVQENESCSRNNLWIKCPARSIFFSRWYKILEIGKNDYFKTLKILTISCKLWKKWSIIRILVHYYRYLWVKRAPSFQGRIWRVKHTHRKLVGKVSYLKQPFNYTSQRKFFVVWNIITSFFHHQVTIPFKKLG